MRNTYALLAGATGLVMTLAACGEKPAGAESASTTTTTQESTTTTTDAAADPSSSTTTTTTTTEPAADAMPPAEAPATTTTESTTTTDAATGTTSATTQTTTTGAIKPATQADVKVGASVTDSAGVSFGKVDAVDAQGVTVSSGAIKAKLPLTSVGVGPNGLVISVTQAEFEAAAKKAGS